MEHACLGPCMDLNMQAKDPYIHDLAAGTCIHPCRQAGRQAQWHVACGTADPCPLSPVCLQTSIRSTPTYMQSSIYVRDALA